MTLAVSRFRRRAARADVPRLELVEVAVAAGVSLVLVSITVLWTAAVYLVVVGS